MARRTTARWDHGRKDGEAHAAPGAAWRGDARRRGGREGGISERRLRAGRRSGDEGGKARLHRLDRRGAALRRQGEGPLRQARHARRRGPEAGLVGHDARQPRARLRGQRHRRRPHPHADALPHQRRQGDAEQRADADAHPRPAQSQRPVHLGREGIRRHQGRARHQAVSRGTARRRRPPARRSRPP